MLSTELTTSDPPTFGPVPRDGDRTRVLVVTLDTLAEQMAGPAIRAWEISRELGRTCDVTLVTFASCSRRGDGFTARAISPAEFRRVVAEHDVVVLQGYVMVAFPWLRRCEQVLVIDLYDPFHLEALEVRRSDSRTERWGAHRTALDELNLQASRGDFFLCASERQRDLWLGHLAAAGRVNPDTYDEDPTLRSLIAVVPFGLDPVAPHTRAGALRGKFDGIGPHDKVVLWGGGVYNWFDPLTLVEAVAEVAADVPNIRLVFLGMRHPNPDVPEASMARALRETSDRLGLTDRHVFFNEQWVSYVERGAYLADADVGVSCHFNNVETDFSFRTRLLDYLWAGLPIVCTDGDTFADLVRTEGIGRVVPPRDVAALAEALREVVTDDAGRSEMAARVQLVAARFWWPRVVAPLVEFCAAPVRAADAGHVDAHGVAARVETVRSALVSTAAGAVRHFRGGGVRQVARRAAWRLRRLRRR